MASGSIAPSRTPRPTRVGVRCGVDRTEHRAVAVARGAEAISPSASADRVEGDDQLRRTVSWAITCSSARSTLPIAALPWTSELGLQRCRAPSSTPRACPARRCSRRPLWWWPGRGLLLATTPTRRLRPGLSTRGSSRAVARPRMPGAAMARPTFIAIDGRRLTRCVLPDLRRRPALDPEPRRAPDGRCDACPWLARRRQAARSCHRRGPTTHRSSATDRAPLASRRRPRRGCPRTRRRRSRSRRCRPVRPSAR